MVKGSRGRQIGPLVSFVLAGTMCLAPAAQAATQVGQTGLPTGTAASNNTVLQTSTTAGPSYTVPSAGVITAWSFQAGGTPPPQLRLKVGRPAGGTNFTIVGDSPIVAPVAGQLNTYTDVRIPAQAGDLIGFFATSGNTMISAPFGNTIVAVGGDAAAENTANFATTYDTVRLDISALLEPDADNDGFGDETQDECPTDASKQNECVAPETTITKGPQDKTRKKTATFEFSSSEAGATFECSLDGGAFAPCTSGQSFKIKKGKHSFSVRATDAAGNVDPTPATDDWKVKKKKKKR